MKIEVEFDLVSYLEFITLVHPDLAQRSPKPVGRIKGEVETHSTQQSRQGAHLYGPSCAHLKFLMPVEWPDVNV